MGERTVTAQTPMTMIPDLAPARDAFALAEADAGPT